MAERLNGILKQGLNLWNKYTSRQKTIIISIALVILLAFALLFFLMNRVDYKRFVVCKDSKEASQVSELLKSEGYRYKYDDNTLTFYVEDDKITDATFLLAQSNVQATGVSMEDLIKNDLGTTNADRVLKLNLFLQNQLGGKIKEMKGVEDANVIYIPKDNASSILTKPEETGATVFLRTNDSFDPTSAETIAQAVATAIGNNDAEKIKVVDQNGALLYGGNKDLYSGTALDNNDYKERLRNTFINNLYMLLVKNGYKDVEIAPHLELDMDKVEEMYTEYTAPEGMDQGYYSKSYTYTTDNSNTSGQGGTPGTSSNDGTDYQTGNANSNSGSSKTNQYEYVLNERKTNTIHEVGAVKSDQSSIGIVLTRVTSVTQEKLEKDGALKDISFDDYVNQNSAPKAGQLDPNVDLVGLVSAATGIAANNIKITVWDQTTFIPKAKVENNWTNYLQIALAVLIVGLLIFVVFRGIRPVEVVETEPELSVEQLLASTKETQVIEDIEFNEVSEVRKMIEKFVDEKPDAVAQLLRNWLNEDWS